MAERSRLTATTVVDTTCAAAVALGLAIHARVVRMVSGPDARHRFDLRKPRALGMWYCQRGRLALLPAARLHDAVHPFCSSAAGNGGALGGEQTRSRLINVALGF